MVITNFRIRTEKSVISSFSKNGSLRQTLTDQPHIYKTILKFFIGSFIQQNNLTLIKNRQLFINSLPTNTLLIF